MKKNTYGALALLLAFALVAAACGDDDGGGNVSTGGTLRLETDGIAYTSGGDPSGEYLGISFGIFTNLLARTLLTYYHTNGDQGNVLVPDLATDFPVISEDGLTYTFTLKDGIKFGPPLSREITSHDIEFAFRRMAVSSVVAQYEFYYDGLITDLFLQDTLPESIAGIETPDDKTIIFHLTRVSPDFVYLVAMPAAAPQPEEVAGCFMDPTYGRYVVSSGPYMYEGSDALDASSCEALVASGPISGFDPASHSYFVRNPDYDADTDDPAVRANYVDRITIDLNTNVDDIYAKIQAGTIDGAVSSGNPPADVLQEYSTNPDLSDRLKSGGDDRTWYITMNLGVAPFDDIHVRKAANLIMDKAGILQAWGGDINGIIATHIQPPALAGLGVDYDPYATAGHQGDLDLAKAEMAQSVYDTDGDGICDAPECSGVVMVNRATSPWTEAEAVVVASLAKIGIMVEVREASDHYSIIQTVANQIPIAMNPGWGKDYPDSSSFVGFLFNGRGIKAEGNYNYSLVGMSSSQAASLGVPFPAGGIASVDGQISECTNAALTDEQAGLDCWNLLDRTLMEDVVPWIPYLWPNIITTIGPAVTAWDFDQFSGVTAFSKVAVDPDLQN